jgi:hypothetical protein
MDFHKYGVDILLLEATLPLYTSLPKYQDS